MNETYQLKTIILDRKSFREHDTKVTVFSLEKGKLELVVRGAKKLKSKLAGHTEPFTLSNIMAIRGKQFDYAGSAFGESNFINIKSNLDKLYPAGRAFMIFKKMVKEGEKDEKLFCLLRDFLNFLEKGQLSVIGYQSSVNFFILKLMIFLGYKPELYNCLVCNSKIKPNGNSFNISKGGLVCLKCNRPNNTHALTISDNCIKVLRLAADDNHNFEKLAKLKINKNLTKEVIEIIESFSKYHIFY
jgi:DNA repair protein RecO (recombination protein O)